MHLSRESLDDGIFTGLLLGPLIASGLLVSALRLASGLSTHKDILPKGWHVEAPAELFGSQRHYTALEALVLSRYSLVSLGTFCSTILLFHVCASWWLEARACKSKNTPEGERASVPRSEGLRSWYFIVFTFGVSFGALGIKALLQLQDIRVWQRT
jgi:dolichol kinase